MLLGNRQDTHHGCVFFGPILLPQVDNPGKRFGVNGIEAWRQSGESQRVQVPSGSPFFSLSLDVPPDSHFAQYICDFSTSGRNVFRLISPAPGNGLPISILVPVKALKPGNYELLIFGAGPNGQQADKIAASTFDLQFSQ